MRRRDFRNISLFVLFILAGVLFFGTSQGRAPYPVLQDPFQAGLKYLSSNRTQEAIREFEKSLQEYPLFSATHSYLSDAHAQIGEWGKALDYINRAIQLDSEISNYYNQRALIFQQQKQFRKALPSMLKALELRPGQYLEYYYFNLAGIYRELLRHDDAVSNYKKTLEIKPKFFQAHIGLGEIYLSRNLMKEAIHEFSTAARIQPKLVESYSLMGVAHARAGSHQEAVDAFRQALELDPKLHMIYYNLSLSLNRLGQMEEAEKNLEIFRSLQDNAEAKEYKELQIEVAGRKDLQVVARVSDEVAPVTLPLPLSRRAVHTAKKQGPASQVGEVFANVTQESGISFRHTNGATAEKYMPETMGSGALFFDYNNDDQLDIFLVNGGSLVDSTLASRASHALYRNNGDGTFQDITPKAGIGKDGYGMGACAADYDNDGWVDLYLTQFGSNFLYRNNGDGTFSDSSDSAGVASPLWSSSCAFADIDNDGYLDLYVVNYVDFALDNHKYCGSHIQGLRSYCHPNVYKGLPDVLYRNNGNGTFTDITNAAAVYSSDGKGLGVAFGDYNNDGWVDIYVANDSVANFLYKNQGDGTFTEVALWTGTAVDGNGPPEASMGIDWGDVNNDGLLDLFVTNLNTETHTLYSNALDGFFTDVTWQAGLGGPTFPFVGFGTAFLDDDNDGDLDVIIAQGHILDNVNQSRDNISYPQRNLLFHNDGSGIFKEVSMNPDANFSKKKVSRGLAVGDIDNDGDLDVLINNCNQTADLYRNEQRNENHWLIIKTYGTKSNRDGIGAQLRLTAGGTTQVREVRAGSSYQSQNDLRVHFGLGKTLRIDRLELRWPSGRVEAFTNLKVDQILKIREGEGLTQ